MKVSSPVGESTKAAEVDATSLCAATQSSISSYIPQNQSSNSVRLSNSKLTLTRSTKTARPPYVMKAVKALL
jgi:hypothetical protein